MDLFPNARRTSSRPSANRTRLRTASGDGVLSIAARAATSEAVSSSKEKCAVIIITTLPFSQRFFGVDQGWIHGFARVILIRSSRDTDNLRKSCADVFGRVQATARLRFHEGHGQVYDLESDIDVHLASFIDGCALSGLRSQPTRVIDGCALSGLRSQPARVIDGCALSGLRSQPARVIDGCALSGLRSQPTRGVPGFVLQDP